MIKSVADEWLIQARHFRDLEKRSSEMAVPSREMSECLMEKAQVLSGLERSLLSEGVTSVADAVALLDVGIELLANPDAIDLGTAMVRRAREALNAVP